MHEEFSIGIVENGISDYFYTGRSETIGKGSVVIINPGDVHSCNPKRGSKWDYKMMYIDAGWFQEMQSEVLNTSTNEFIPSTKNHLCHPDIYNRFKYLFSLLHDSNDDQLLIEQSILTFFTDLFLLDQTSQLSQKKTDHRALLIARDFIADQCEKDIKIDDIARASGLSRSHLIREFRNRFGMTPHAYKIAKRIDKAKVLLRCGLDISTVAVSLGFTDQSHFHRNFKRIVAATPKQYKDSFMGDRSLLRTAS